MVLGINKKEHAQSVTMSLKGSEKEDRARNVGIRTELKHTAYVIKVIEGVGGRRGHNEWNQTSSRVWH